MLFDVFFKVKLKRQHLPMRPAHQACAPLMTTGTPL
jgi:hypothetical protein